MRQCDPNFNLKVNISQHDTYIDLIKSATYILWSSNFASYLEDYLMEKHCTWDNGSLWLKDRPSKTYVGQWPIFHDPMILPYIIVRLKLFLYIKKWHRPGVFVPLRALALVFTSVSFDKGHNFVLMFTIHGQWRYLCHMTGTIWATIWQNQQSECAPSEDSDQPGHPPSLISLHCPHEESLCP